MNIHVKYMINKFIYCFCVCWLATLGTVMIIRIVKNKTKVLLKVKSSIPVIESKHHTSKAINKLIIHFYRRDNKYIYTSKRDFKLLWEGKTTLKQVYSVCTEPRDYLVD